MVARKGRLNSWDKGGKLHTEIATVIAVIARHLNICRCPIPKEKSIGS